MVLPDVILLIISCLTLFSKIVAVWALILSRHTQELTYHVIATPDWSMVETA